MGCSGSSRRPPHRRIEARQRDTNGLALCRREPALVTTPTQRGGVFGSQGGSLSKLAFVGSPVRRYSGHEAGNFHCFLWGGASRSSRRGEHWGTSLAASNQTAFTGDDGSTLYITTGRLYRVAGGPVVLSPRPNRRDADEPRQRTGPSLAALGDRRLPMRRWFRVRPVAGAAAGWTARARGHVRGFVDQS